jgi:hypothetical protein
MNAQTTSTAEGKRATPSRKPGRFKRALTTIYVVIRAVCRFMFVDMGGSGFFEKNFTPSSRISHEYEFQGETEYEHGLDMSLAQALGMSLVAILFCWIWIPVLLGVFGWDAFKRWIGDDV